MPLYIRRAIGHRISGRGRLGVIGIWRLRRRAWKIGSCGTFDCYGGNVGLASARAFVAEKGSARNLVSEIRLIWIKFSRYAKQLDCI